MMEWPCASQSSIGDDCSENISGPSSGSREQSRGVRVICVPHRAIEVRNVLDEAWAINECTLTKHTCTLLVHRFQQETDCVNDGGRVVRAVVEQVNYGVS